MYEKSAEKTCMFTGATLVVGDPHRIVRDFTNDTRQIKNGSCFVCFVGKMQDGNDFTLAALERGAGCVAMTRPPKQDEIKAAQKTDSVILRAENDDPYAFLQKLACAYRQEEGWLTVGITGSVGKTTTRQMTLAALAPSFEAFSNEGNLNSAIGVPLTILNAPANKELFICEMGMDRAGEIGQIASAALPNVGCITNVGTAHIGILGSQINIARAKAEMVHWLGFAGTLPREGGAFVNESASILKSDPGKKGEPMEDASASPYEPVYAKENAKKYLEPTLFLDASDQFSTFIEKTFAKREGVTTCYVQNFGSACEADIKEKELKKRKKKAPPILDPAAEPAAGPAAGPAAASITEPTTEQAVASTAEPVADSIAEKLEGYTFNVVSNADGSTSFIYHASSGKDYPIHCPLLGLQMVDDAVFAMGIADHLGADLNKAAAAIEKMQPTSLRAEIKPLKMGGRLIDDSYNANVASMISGIDLLANMTCTGPKIALLGEMGELGESAQKLHWQVGDYAGKQGFSRLIFVGEKNAERMYEAAIGAGQPEAKTILVDSAHSAILELSSILKEESDPLVLVKGSRFLHLDQVAKEMCT